MNDHEMMKYLERSKELLVELIDDEEISKPYKEAINRAIKQLNGKVNILIGLSSDVIEDVFVYRDKEEAKKQYEEMKKEYDISENEEERECDKNEIQWFIDVLR